MGILARYFMRQDSWNVLKFIYREGFEIIEICKEEE